MQFCSIIYSESIIAQDEHEIDWDSPSGVEEDGIVEILDTEIPLSDALFEQMKQEINPLEPCGILLYTVSKAFVDNIE